MGIVPAGVQQAEKPFATSAVSASLAAPRLHKQCFLYFVENDKAREEELKRPCRDQTASRDLRSASLQFLESIQKGFSIEVQYSSHLCTMKTGDTTGYCAIGVFRAKTEHNIGTLWRSAYILGAAYIFTVDGKYKKQTSDVLRTWARIPLFQHKNFDELLASIPYDCRLVGVEIDNRSEMLHTFEHPKRAIYLLGAEDTGLPDFVKDKCHYLIRLPGNSSLNVGVTGSIVLHDRVSKMPTELPPHHKG